MAELTSNLSLEESVQDTPMEGLGVCGGKGWGGHTTGNTGDTELLLSVPPAQRFPVVCPCNCCTQSSREAPAQIPCKSRNSETEGVVQSSPHRSPFLAFQSLVGSSYRSPCEVQYTPAT